MIEFTFMKRKITVEWRTIKQRHKQMVKLYKLYLHLKELQSDIIYSK